MNNKIKGIGYLRYSDSKQDGKHSLEIQKSQILLLAEREGVEIIAWRIDKATSAFRGNIAKRSGIQKIYEDLENGVEAICFYEESRITRSITDFYYDVYEPITTQYPKLRFYSTQSNGVWNPDDPLVQAKLVFAAEESEIKSTRAKDAQQNLLSAGKRPGSPAPIGYNMVDGILYPNEDAIVVQYIFHLAGWGHSRGSIAAHLNNCEITTAKIKHWNSSTIGYILNNKVYYGNLAWNVRTSYENSKPKPDDEIDLLFEHAHEPIVSATSSHLIKQVNDLKKNHGIMDTPYYLRGVIKCKKCDSFMSAKDNSPKGKKGKYMVYRCLKCKRNLPIIKVHQVVLNDLLSKWSTQLSSIVTTANEQLVGWNKNLETARKKFKIQLEQTLYNERMLASDIKENKQLEEAFIDSKHYLQNEILNITITMDEINRILDDDDGLSIFIKYLQQQSFLNFTDTELRTFFLMYFKDVIVNLEKNNDIEINYRLSPFVALENATGYFTEKIAQINGLSG
ncbi:resolvase [Lentibacillus populi]|uniref:Resolvase n=1 Tax=Lentibacillus populi TaxID=1827502 RepID=A0A9W5U2B8_9BACI|nr:recombinase family protein [Lentibacillus populi]GGB62271.1 resolvase [Lentibacillus populi]